MSARSVSDLAANVRTALQLDERFRGGNAGPLADLADLVARLETAEAENERLAAFPSALAAEIEAREAAEAEVAALTQERAEYDRYGGHLWKHRAEAAEAALAEYLEEIKQLVRSRDMYVTQRDEARAALADLVAIRDVHLETIGSQIRELADTRRALADITDWAMAAHPNCDQPCCAKWREYRALAATDGGTGQEQQP